MCGIAGWIGAPVLDPSVTGRIIKKMYHRGPDAQVVKVWPDATLIHTRLSIIDLSPAGAQPISNEDSTIWVVFNGEIFNHNELRKNLEIKGHTFRGRSDSEVIPHLYEEYGSNFVEYLRGMFVIAVWDTIKKKMILVRDRFGIKPIFYSPSRERLSFASELQALREVPDIDCRPDSQAIYDFAALFFIPAPLTLYKGIRSLAPGEIVESSYKSGQVVWSVRQFHKWAIHPDNTLTFPEAVIRAAELMEVAVKKQLESDVDLGTFLSGGIDSSLVTQAARRYYGRELRSFNVEFSDQKYDETWAALAVSQHVKSKHTTLSMGNTSGSWDFVISILTQAGQPFADTSVFAASAICQLMQKNLKVALSGDGGDEGFGGYDSFKYLEYVARLQQAPRFMLHIMNSTVSRFTKLNLLPRRFSQRFFDLSKADDVGIIENLNSWIRPIELTALSQAHNLLPIRRWFEPEWDHVLPKNSSRVEKLSALNTEIQMRLFLANDYLFKVDLASMRSSLEVRVPMLDEDLIEFGLTLPHKLKVYGNESKRVLRGVAKKKLPRNVALKPKQGFSIPIDTWVDDNFKSRLSEYLLSSDSRISEYFRPEAYREILSAFCNDQELPEISRAGLFGRAIMLLSLELCLEEL